MTLGGTGQFTGRGKALGPGGNAPISLTLKGGSEFDEMCEVMFSSELI